MLFSLVILVDDGCEHDTTQADQQQHPPMAVLEVAQNRHNEGVTHQQGACRARASVHGHVSRPQAQTAQFERSHRLSSANTGPTAGPAHIAFEAAWPAGKKNRCAKGWCLRSIYRYVMIT